MNISHVNEVSNETSYCTTQTQSAGNNLLTLANELQEVVSQFKV